MTQKKTICTGNFTIFLFRSFFFSLFLPIHATSFNIIFFHCWRVLNIIVFLFLVVAVARFNEILQKLITRPTRSQSIGVYGCACILSTRKKCKRATRWKKCVCFSIKNSRSHTTTFDVSVACGWLLAYGRQHDKNICSNYLLKHLSPAMGSIKWKLKSIRYVQAGCGRTMTWMRSYARKTSTQIKSDELLEAENLFLFCQSFKLKIAYVYR